MNVAVFGCGYVGLTTAVGLAEMGHHVLGVDTDAAKIQRLQQGRVPFLEDGLEKVLRHNVKQQRIQFFTDGKRAVGESDVVICAVSTVQNGEETDLSSVFQVAQLFGKHAPEHALFINKSTVPVGTTETVREVLKPSHTLVSNPEFLRESTALQDFFRPDRVVLGLEKDTVNARSQLQNLFCYEDDIPFVFTTLRNAELMKYASNAFLATKISFANELARLCEVTGGDVEAVVQGMGLDPRIGEDFLRAGIGFGGSCLPKDLRAIVETGEKAGVPLPLMTATLKVNDQQVDRFLGRLQETLGSLSDKKIAVWGLSFKPNTNDLRDAPSLRVARQLLTQKARVAVFDPASLEGFRALFGDKASYGKDQYDVLSDADALLILTEWSDFQQPDFKKMHTLMKRPLIADGRNVYDPDEIRAHGFQYFSIGRM